MVAELNSNADELTGSLEPEEEASWYLNEYVNSEVNTEYRT